MPKGAAGENKTKQAPSQSQVMKSAFKLITGEKEGEEEPKRKTVLGTKGPMGDKVKSNRRS